ncbi:MAG: glycoside hydrolase [Nitrospira sp.]|nr:glycoside hydrolase [Nitrospira sp.]
MSGRHSLFDPFCKITFVVQSLLIVASLGLLFVVSTASFAQVTITEINPNQSTLDPIDPDGASGGRVNGLASVASNNKVFYAASEWGGIYKSTDQGRTWFRLNRHLPMATWDVEIDPKDPNKVYATSFYDGRINSLAGINVSTDGGNTWTHPATATPPETYNCPAIRREEPSAFGISVDPNKPQNVYIGTNCGLAISKDSGVTWKFVDPTPEDPANNVWDVVAHHDGIIDICGDDGHFRSTDGGTTWITGIGLPSGRCSIAVSPYESHVLFVVVGTSIFESDDGGTTWPTTFVNPSPQGRIPFVATNRRSQNSFDLWFGDVRLYRASCRTPSPPAPGGTPRCPPSGTWAGPFTRSAGGHDDSGDIVFDTQATIDACPMLFSSDLIL